MNEITKEERPDELAGRSELSPQVPAPGEPGSEGIHYRVVTVDKACEEAGRFDKHKGMGYGVAKKAGRQVLMGCRKEDHEARVKAAGDRSVKRIKDPVVASRNVSSLGGLDIHTMETGKGPATVLDDN